MIDLSVIIPVCDRYKLLCEAMQSVLLSLLSPNELIVVFSPKLNKNNSLYYPDEGFYI